MDKIYEGDSYKEVYEKMHALIPVLKPSNYKYILSSTQEDLYEGGIDLVGIVQR